MTIDVYLLKRFRDLRGMTQNDVSQATGMSRWKYGKLEKENSSQAEWKIEDLKKVMDALELTTEERMKLLEKLL